MNNSRRDGGKRLREDAGSDDNQDGDYDPDADTTGKKRQETDRRGREDAAKFQVINFKSLKPVEHQPKISFRDAMDMTREDLAQAIVNAQLKLNDVQEFCEVLNHFCPANRLLSTATTSMLVYLSMDRVSRDPGGAVGNRLRNFIKYPSQDILTNRYNLVTPERIAEALRATNGEYEGSDDELLTAFLEKTVLYAPKPQKPSRRPDASRPPAAAFDNSAARPSPSRPPAAVARPRVAYSFATDDTVLRQRRVVVDNSALCDRIKVVAGSFYVNDQHDLCFTSVANFEVNVSMILDIVCNLNSSNTRRWEKFSSANDVELFDKVTNDKTLWAEFLHWFNSGCPDLINSEMTSDHSAPAAASSAIGAGAVSPAGSELFSGVLNWDSAGGGASVDPPADGGGASAAGESDSAPAAHEADGDVTGAAVVHAPAPDIPEQIQDGIRKLFQDAITYGHAKFEAEAAGKRQELEAEFALKKEQAETEARNVSERRRKLLEDSLTERNQQWEAEMADKKTQFEREAAEAKAASQREIAAAKAASDLAIAEAKAASDLAIAEAKAASQREIVEAKAASQREAAEAKAELDRLKASCQSSNEELTKVKAGLDQANIDFRESKDRYDKLKNDIDSTLTDCRSVPQLRAELAAMQAAKAQLERDSAGVEQRLGQLRQEGEGLQARSEALTAREAEIAAAGNTLEGREADLTARGMRLDQLQAKLESDKEDLQRQTAAAKKMFNDYKAKNEICQAGIAANETRSAELNVREQLLRARELALARGGAVGGEAELSESGSTMFVRYVEAAAAERTVSDGTLSMGSGQK